MGAKCCRQAENANHKSMISSVQLEPTSQSQLSYQTVHSTNGHESDTKALQLDQIPSRTDRDSVTINRQAENANHKSIISSVQLEPTSKSQLSYQTVHSTNGHESDTKALQLDQIPSRTDRDSVTITRQAENANHKSMISSVQLEPTSKSQLSYQTVHSTNGHESDTKALQLDQIPSRTDRDSVTINSLPNEILLLIFWKLKVDDLFKASLVCHRWHELSGDNLLWKKIFVRFHGATTEEEEDEVSVSEVDPWSWKNLCLRSCKVRQDQIHIGKRMFYNIFTRRRRGQQFMLREMCMIFNLSFITSKGLSYTMPHNEIRWSETSVRIQWHKLELPDDKDIQSIRIHACCPLMFYRLCHPVEDGFRLRSLLMAYNGDMRDLFHEQTVLGSNELIHLHKFTKDLSLLKFKASNIPVVMCTLHYHDLYFRCFNGGPDRLWSSPDLPCKEDYTNSEYGLCGYKCTILIQNISSLLMKMKFRGLSTKRENLADGYATFVPMMKSFEFTKLFYLREINFPCRTTLFKGIVQEIGTLDIKLTHQRSSVVVWAVSTNIYVERPTQTTQSDFEPSTDKTINYQDDIGKLHLEFDKNVHGTQYLCAASISLSLAAINKAFRKGKASPQLKISQIYT